MDPSEEDITEVGQWAALRRALLQAHFRIAAQEGALQWRKTAVQLRGVPAHRVVGFGVGSAEDVDEDEIEYEAGSDEGEDA